MATAKRKEGGFGDIRYLAQFLFQEYQDELKELLVSLQFTSTDPRDLISAILLAERTYPSRHVV